MNDPTAKVRLTIPAEFFAEVELPLAPHADVRITRFVVSPLESYAGYFGPGTTAEVVSAPEGADPETIQQAAVAYWQAANDGTWPLDVIDWEE